MQKSKAYHKYVKQLATGRFTHFEDWEIEDIVFDFEDDMKYEEAERAVRFGLSQNPDSEQLIKLSILVKIDTGKLDEAEQMLAPYRDDGMANTADLCFSLALRQHHYTEACEYLLHGIEEEILTADQVWEQLNSAYDLLPKEILRQSLIRLAALAPNDTATLRDIASLLIEMEYYTDETIQVLNRALDRDAYSLDGWQLMARCLYNMNRLEECLKACDYGLAIEPNDLMLRFLRGFIYSEQENHPRTIEDFRVLRDIREGKIHVHRQNDLPIEEQEQQLDSIYEILAQSCLHENEEDEAIDCLNKLILRHPRMGEYYIRLASAYLLKGDLPAALTVCENGHLVESGREDIASMRLNLLLQMHRFEEAMTAVDDLLSINPDHQGALFAKAELLRLTEHNEEAFEVYKKLLPLSKIEQPHVRSLVESYFESIDREDLLEE
jgi:tetratricopeptide (TPR) repeat protein